MVVDIRTWVKNVVNQPPTVTSNDIIVPLSTPTMSAKAVLICRPNSHPFQERTLILEQPVKVGRSVARARATSTNAIFDCKVLSRHHALLWYKDGKFYLQDTKSSNGTFVNNNRLSPGGFESVPHEVCSGDIVQFGVDVVENNRKVTHGCIVATLKLYLHDGKEAKASHSLSVGSNIGSVPLDELYKLNQYLQDALQREQLLESKLSSLHNLVEQARETTNLSWQAFIGEDRLLSRVEILENQLLAYSKNYSEDKMREELLRLQEEKSDYQNTAKENLRNLHQERLDAIAKVTILQQSLNTSEQEVVVYKEQYAKAQDDLQELAQRFSTNELHEAEITSQLAVAEEREQEAEMKMQELLDRVDTQNATIQEMLKQIEKLQQDKYILRALITELDKCTLNNCPVEIKFKVDKIINEGLVEDIKNTNLVKMEEMKNLDENEENFEENENHKENNGPLLNQTENNKQKEFRETPEEMDVIKKIQEELKAHNIPEENDNKTDEVEVKGRNEAELMNWQLHLEGDNLDTTKISQDTLKNDAVDNIQFAKKDVSEISVLKQELAEARNDVHEKTLAISKMSDEIENLLETSALVNAKINILENDLLAERQLITKYKNDLETLKSELTQSNKSLHKNKEDEKQLKIQVENLISELNKRPTIESFEDLKLQYNDLKILVTKIKAETKIAEEELQKESHLMKLEQDKDVMGRFAELEEELVVMKEQYAKCNEDKIVLNQNLEKIRRDYRELTNRSHNVIFFYIAPLVFLVAYLLFSALFS